MNLDILIKVYFLYYFILLLQCLAVFTSQQFKMVTDVYVDLKKVIVTYTFPSIQECVLTCLIEPKMCRAVSYDPHSSECYLGTALEVRLYARSETLQVMHMNPPCYQMPDFQMYEMGSITTCAWTCENETKSYADATADCKAKGAHLYTIKSTEKLSYPVNYGKSYWVGLDDIKTENVFHWADDDSLLTDELKAQIFMPDQPNNYLNQDCILLQGKEHQLNDWTCSDRQPYICEISDFS
ncbi:hypothetical protein Btru_024590 [Bulinus truncatus]|nr:hypothetical protein Btru_024590 [Bulinus truncatus]